MVFLVRELVSWWLARNRFTLSLLQDALIELLAGVLGVLFDFIACIGGLSLFGFSRIGCLCWCISIPRVFNVIQDVPTTLLETFLNEIPLVLPLSARHLKSVVKVHLPSILFLLLPLQITLKLFHVYLLNMLVAIFLLRVFTFVITDGVIVTARVVDKINSFLEVSRPFEYFNVRPFIKSLLVHRVRVGVHKYTTVPGSSSILLVLIERWERLGLRMLGYISNTATSILLILPISKW